ncbi:ATP-dependent DNA helicase RecG [Olsenella urininfantis]|uniref:ATP-dependent DNA helicase RecG n=1 Tax=Olsenella urininfantis TaxID=1871033 RepID=UPI0009878BFE|nr:ATP-dependent DNA helicase RecG [Olsenella urininfantis]
MAHEPTIATVADRLSCSCSLTDDVSLLRYVSGARRDALLRLGVRRVRDLLLRVPHRYLDFSHTTDIAHADVGQDSTIVATVDKVTLKRPRPRMQVVEVFALDATGVIQASFFHQPWIAEQLKPGDVVALSGRVEFAYGFKQLRSPFFERLEPGEASSGYARILPVHSVGDGLSASWMRRIVAAALADRGDVCDFLPSSLVAERGLMSLSRALRELHFPSSQAAREAARRRLAFDELLCLQLTLRARQQMELRDIRPHAHRTDGPRLEALVSALPFSLSGEQREAAGQILSDMAAPRVMNRLLLGDVGTGKTAVAALALAAVADSGLQAAMMAPTSVLARQYAQVMGPWLTAAHVSWALVTGSTPPEERRLAARGIASGETCVAFGTTALLSDDLDFASLSLTVIDEQHRFGVDQRAALRRKGPGADLLAMTATPIPRTLALSLYGDLDCSRIRHRPRPGAGVKTSCIAPESLDLAYAAIREACERGRQAYVICPLVDDSDDGLQLEELPESSLSRAKRLHSAVSTLRELSERVFPELRCSLLHGRMSAQEKDAAMEGFHAGRVDVLVSTTVVEVGVDVPNATVMLVHDADRFGLATLHQLRGRVGRGDLEGSVFLSCAARRGTPARKRLAALEASTDGAELAEMDLRLRHEGELLGYRQHGGISLQVSDLAVDGDLVALAHEDALGIVEADPGLLEPRHRPLALELRDRFGAYFEEVERA